MSKARKFLVRFSFPATLVAAVFVLGAPVKWRMVQQIMDSF